MILFYIIIFICKKLHISYLQKKLLDFFLFLLIKIQWQENTKNLDQKENLIKKKDHLNQNLENQTKDLKIKLRKF